MKYNWSIIGHEKQLARLESDLSSGNLAHAYLLAGPNSIGKFTVARKMAGILQCEKDFCHRCKVCLQVQNGSHLDTVELSGGVESIKINDIRALVDRCNMTRQSKHKMFLIQSVERMTHEAANSFLKVLEEPPPRTVFILTTNNIRDILPTIVSRVRVIKFGTVSIGYLKKKLLELYPNHGEEDLNRICLFSMGKTGKAVHLMEHPDSLAKYMEIYHLVVGFLANKSVSTRFDYVEELLSDEKIFNMFFDVLLSVLRSKILSGDRESKRLISIVDKAHESLFLLKKNVNSRLVLENLMLTL